jgi:hypothetical protein
MLLASHDEGANQPWAGDAVDLGESSRDPAHTISPIHIRSTVLYRAATSFQSIRSRNLAT